jgi:hypothetical protein
MIISETGSNKMNYVMEVPIKKSVPVKPTSAKRLNASQTNEYIRKALAGTDLDIFKSVQVDRKEAARFIARQAKMLRFISLSAGLPTVAFLTEEIYYSAFEQSILKDKKDFEEFRELLKEIDMARME